MESKKIREKINEIFNENKETQTGKTMEEKLKKRETEDNENRKTKAKLAKN